MKKNPTWKEYVDNSICQYPTLYAKSNWEDSEFSVAHQTFIVLGNGMEWGTMNGTKFVLGEDQHERINGEWEKVGFAVLADVEHPLHRFINNVWWERMDEHYHNKEMYFSKPPEAGDEEYTYLQQSEFEGKPFPDFCGPRIVRHDTRVFNPKIKRPERPYPNFQRTYSKAWLIEPEKIEPDWLLAMLKHHEHWFNYFTTNENPHLHVATGPEYLERWKDLTVAKVQEDWRVPVWNGSNIDEAVQYLRDKQLKENITFLRETVERLRV